MRGCERKIIMLKGTDSEIFDEAYFLIKRDFKDGEEKEIVDEAKRIVDLNRIYRPSMANCKKDKRGFFLGAFIGFTLGIIFLLLQNIF